MRYEKRNDLIVKIDFKKDKATKSPGFKKNLSKIFITVLGLMIVSLIFAASLSGDGCVHIYDKDMWSLGDEEQQFCAINYKNGYQHMLLTINIDPEISGEEAVWIFPVPAPPEKTNIDILKGFPLLEGYDIQESAKETVSSVFAAIRATQIYPLLWYLRAMSGSKSAEGGSEEGIQVFQSVERMGLTTELVSVLGRDSLINYLHKKGLNLPESSLSVLGQYIGKDYSFVITRISDIKKFREESEGTEEERWRGWQGHSLGVSIKFPTERIFFPLLPTSVYGKKRVPAVLYVMDYVEPQLYPSIKEGTRVNYFNAWNIYAPSSLKGFFSGFDSVDFPEFIDEEGIRVSDVKYTKIKIDVPSEDLIDDLWMDIKKTPLQVRKANHMERWAGLYGVLSWIISSCLAGLFAGMVFSRQSKMSKIKWILLGLWNLLSLVGVAYAANFGREKLKIPLPGNEGKSVSPEGIIFRTLISSYIICLILLSCILVLIGFWDNIDLFVIGFLIVTVFALFWLTVALLFPFIRSFYWNRNIFKYIVLFSFIYLGFTFIFQAFLIWII